MYKGTDIKLAMDSSSIKKVAVDSIYYGGWCFIWSVGGYLLGYGAVMLLHAVGQAVFQWVNVNVVPAPPLF